MRVARGEEKNEVGRGTGRFTMKQEVWLYGREGGRGAVTLT